MSKVVNSAAGSKSGIRVVSEPGPETLDRLVAPAVLEDGAEVAERVAGIIRAVRDRGDAALVELQDEIDGVDFQPSDWEIPRSQWDAATRVIDRKLRAALELAERRIREFHQDQREASRVYRLEDGTVLGTSVFPLERVGIYVPGGTASYPSSVLMNAVPARVAGVGEIVAVTPPGRLSVQVLAACSIAGIDRLFRLGGAHAVAALAFGTETVPRVDKIVGPGNRWVAEAKKQLVQVVGIDMVAGPTEVLIIADESACPDHVAADLLAQAEHDRDACAWLVTTDRRLVADVDRRLAEMIAASPRRGIAAASIRNNGVAVVVRELDHAVEIANRKAPEHLELLVRRPGEVLPAIRNAGAVFIGKWSPEPMGDYVAGPSHVLPTGGTARFASPLGVYDFVKRMSVIEYTRARFAADAAAAIEIAESEGLVGHADAIRVRGAGENG